MLSQIWLVGDLQAGSGPCVLYRRVPLIPIALPYFLTPQDVPGSYTFPASALESAPSSF